MTTQEIQHAINELRTIIASGKTSKALDKLIDFTKQLKVDKFRDETLHLKAAKSTIETEERQRLMASNELSVRKNKINQELLLLLTRMENELVEGQSPRESQVNTNVPPIAPPIMQPPSTSNVNWKVIIPIILVVLAGLVYFIFFMNKDTSEKNACEIEFEKATNLFDTKDYTEAKKLFTDIKFNCPIDDEKEIERYIRLCNEGLETDGIAESFAIQNVDMTIDPQLYEGECPVTANFTGIIYTNQKEGILSCQIGFSKKLVSESKEFDIRSDGTAIFSFSVIFDKKSISDGDMNAILEVTSPGNYTSEPFAFNLKCKEEIKPSDHEEAIVDKRDGRKYRTKKIGKDTWLLDNMNLEINNSKCLNCDEDGRHYKKSIIAKVCPTGYVLPTVAQFQAARTKLGSFDNFVKILELEPAGSYYGKMDAYKISREVRSYFWAASKEKTLSEYYHLDFPNKKATSKSMNNVSSLYYYSCRCVKNPLYLIGIDLIHIKPFPPTKRDFNVKKPKN